MTQDMASRAPERSHWPADSRVLAGCGGVYVAGVGDLAPRSGSRVVDFGVREGLEGGHVEFFGKRVDTGVFEEVGAVAVDVGDRGVGF